MQNEDEERYFRAREAEAREALRKKLSAEASDLEERRRIAASAGTDLSVADRIKALGFDGDSARIFDLMPLVHVAWADGKITKAEREHILELVTARGIEPGSEAFNTMESMLEQQPDEAFARQTLAVLRDLIGDDHDKRAGVVELCTAVAAASGGILGLGIGSRVSDEEKQRIGEIAATLDPGSRARVEEQLA